MYRNRREGTLQHLNSLTNRKERSLVAQIETYVTHISISKLTKEIQIRFNNQPLCFCDAPFSFPCALPKESISVLMLPYIMLIVEIFTSHNVSDHTG